MIELLDEAFFGPSWHGPSLLGSIRGLNETEAAWRPGKGRHNIWELVVHAAYWKYVVRRRLTGEKRGAFTLKGSNWWTRPQDGSAGEWKRDVALLVSEHAALREAMTSCSDARLTRRAAPG